VKPRGLAAGLRRLISVHPAHLLRSLLPRHEKPRGKMHIALLD